MRWQGYIARIDKESQPKKDNGDEKIRIRERRGRLRRYDIDRSNE